MQTEKDEMIKIIDGWIMDGGWMGLQVMHDLKQTFDLNYMFMNYLQMVIEII